MDRDMLLRSITTGRERLAEALARFDDQAMLDRVDGDWTRKDVLAHLEAWERRVVERLHALRRGEAIPADDTDALNAQFHARDRDRSLADVRSGEGEAYASLVTAIEGASDEELFDGRHFAWTEGDAFADWFRGNTDEHYDEHLEQLTRPAR
jgi:hypothetical protein